MGEKGRELQTDSGRERERGKDREGEREMMKLFL